MGPQVSETPIEYFKRLVESSISRQHLHVGDLTTYYLVNLLCQYIRLDTSVPGYEQEPLAVQLARAFEVSGSQQRGRLRRLGDFSLFMSGFFSDSFVRRVVDVDYYVSMGEYAYGTLSRYETDVFSEVFEELSQKFVGFTDVLADICGQTSLERHTDLLRLYERCLRTGSLRDEQKLIERGIIPNRSIGKRFIQ